MSIQLPSRITEEVELGELDLADLRQRAQRDEFAPTHEPELFRYAVYLGAAYIEAERIVAKGPDVEAAFAQLHRLFGAAGGHGSVLRFHYSEQARNFADEQRAHTAHERTAGAYEGLVEKMEREIATREQRIANLERAVG